MDSRQAFKVAFSKARSLKASAVGAAEYSVEHGRYCVGYDFGRDVRLALGMHPHACSAVEFRAVSAAAHVVAVDVAMAANPSPSLADRLAAHRADDGSYDYT